MNSSNINHFVKQNALENVRGFKVDNYTTRSAQENPVISNFVVFFSLKNAALFDSSLRETCETGKRILLK